VGLRLRCFFASHLASLVPQVLLSKGKLRP
jgi:hypothetical protein